MKKNFNLIIVNRLLNSLIDCHYFFNFLLILHPFTVSSPHHETLKSTNSNCHHFTSKFNFANYLLENCSSQINKSCSKLQINSCRNLLPKEWLHLCRCWDFIQVGYWAGPDPAYPFIFIVDVFINLRRGTN